MTADEQSQLPERPLSAGFPVVICSSMSVQGKQEQIYLELSCQLTPIELISRMLRTHLSLLRVHSIAPSHQVRVLI